MNENTGNKNEYKRYEGWQASMEKSETFVTNASLSMNEMKIIIEDLMERKVDFHYPRVGSNIQDVAIDMAVKAKSVDRCVICVCNEHPMYGYPGEHADDVLARYYKERANKRRVEKSE